MRRSGLSSLNKSGSRFKRQSGLTKKFQVYERNRVLEYVVWRVLDRAVDWFVLRGKQYQRLSPTPENIFKSTVFPGLWLDAAALIAADMARVLAVLEEGLKTPEHAEFVKHLQEKRSARHG